MVGSWGAGQDQTLIYSATDLVGYLSCQSLTAFDKTVALGEATAPKVWSPMLEVLWERGAEHEKQYVENLKSSGVTFREIPGTGIDSKSLALTRQAMQDGVDIIVQAALADGVWVGRADVLLKVEGSSDFGDWLYEPVDTKLARETKSRLGPSTLLIC